MLCRLYNFELSVSGGIKPQQAAGHMNGSAGGCHGELGFESPNMLVKGLGIKEVT